MPVLSNYRIRLAFACIAGLSVILPLDTGAEAHGSTAAVAASNALSRYGSYSSDPHARAIVNAIHKFKGNSAYDPSYMGETVSQMRVEEIKTSVKKGTAHQCGPVTYIIKADNGLLAWATELQDGSIKVSARINEFRECTGFAIDHRHSKTTGAPYYADGKVYKWTPAADWTGYIGKGRYTPN